MKSKNTSHTVSLVIVESPTKAKTIRKFLSHGYLVEASMGHVRDLPQSAADIPAKLKKEPWAALGVNVEKDFEPLYIIPKGKSKIIQDLKKKIQGVDSVYLATDEDREGESISWHLVELLKPKVPVYRMVFHEITKRAIDEALRSPRQIDTRLVKAQEARRILDRLVGYTLSPLIWKKIAYGLSAGRVQSAALRLVVDRERERIRFVKSEYWDIKAVLSPGFESRLVGVAGKKVATGKDFDETTGNLKTGKDVKVLGEAEAQSLANQLLTEKWSVLGIERKESNSRPGPPFITSTLQQEGNRKLGLSAKDTMRVAQALYEEGLITYMRTDSPALSQEAIQAARNEVSSLYGNDFLSPEPRQYGAKSKGAQEAHEAIRPAGSQFVHPKDAGLSGRELALYDLIWKKTMATQMADAKKESMTVFIEAGDTKFQSTGSRILFPGYLRAYVEGEDDPEAALEDREVLLPDLKEGQILRPELIHPEGHETKPPARFTEASLIQTMEKAGIGRPSTYASVIGTVVERGYVRKNAAALVPTFTGFAVIQLLEKHFEQLVNLEFTSKMEQSLDDIAEGSLESVPYLRSFYLGKDGLSSQVKDKDKKIKPDECRSIDLPHLKDVEIRVGRFGPYIVQEENKQHDELHASIPEDVAPGDLTQEQIKELLEIQARGPEPIGVDPKSGKKIYCLVGRFGPYVQLGEVSETEAKPRRASVPKGVSPKDISIEKALELLSLPRELGNHPETGKPVLANLGRFGPYVMHDGNFRSLKKEDSPYTVTLTRALELLAQEKKSRRSAQVIKELGKHPDFNDSIQICDGQYGMYAKSGKLNATLPKEWAVDSVSLEMAAKVLKERMAQKGTKRRKSA